MDDSAEAIETQNVRCSGVMMRAVADARMLLAQEIDEMLSGSFTSADDEACLKELEDIEAAEAAALGADMPDAPGRHGSLWRVAMSPQPCAVLAVVQLLR